LSVGKEGGLHLKGGRGSFHSQTYFKYWFRTPLETRGIFQKGLKGSLQGKIKNAEKQGGTIPIGAKRANVNAQQRKRGGPEELSLAAGWHFSPPNRISSRTVTVRLTRLRGCSFTKCQGMPALEHLRLTLSFIRQSLTGRPKLSKKVYGDL